MSELIIRRFWDAMGSNDFDHASTWLHPDFEYFMPQTHEYLAGRENFARMNAAYPAEGKWVFSIQSIVSGGDEAVSDVKITDGLLQARAITFHTLKDGLILRQKEFWTDPYPAPDWRAKWMTVVDAPPFG